VTAPEIIKATADRLAADGYSNPWPARDPVNVPMIRSWLEAIGNPSGGALSDAEPPDTAPPGMIQVWTMPGLHRTRGGDDPLGVMNTLLDDLSYTSIVATNCDHTYYRPVRVGEQLAVQSRLLDVTGPKRTALGEGWFVTTRSVWTSYDDPDPVARMDFRVLRFRPEPRTKQPQGDLTPSDPPGAVIRPVVSPDTQFFWEGTAARELRVQRCPDCGTTRHPPGPRCPACGSMTPGYVVAAGVGEVYSYVVHHHPPVPGKKLPLVIALVQLPEGVRIVGELLGLPPDQVTIGLPVRAEFIRIDDDLTLPAWRASAANTLPPQVIDVTPTFVISTALATRDFQDVHHDRNRAIAGGAKDIFLNILTTTGLVQRYVTDWAAPGGEVKAISIRLGVPCHAGDTLTLAGEVTADDGVEQTVQVVGRCSLGDHVTATVRLAPRPPGGS
jgi:uncharacterized protein